MTDPTLVADARTEKAASVAEPTSRDLDALDRSMLSGLAWTGAAKWGVQVLSWASTIFVVRLLTPTDYGIVGMAAAFLTLLQPLSDFGIAAAVVQDRTLSRQQITRLSGFAALLGCVWSLATVGAAYPLANFFNEPALITVVPLMGLGFVFGALRIVPGAMLVREMRFRVLAMIETAEALTVLTVTVGLALLGRGYWALILGSLSGRVVGAVLALVAQPIRMTPPTDIARLARNLRFGAWVAASSVAWYAYTNADRVVVGRLIGEAALGVYSIAVTLASLPVEKISQLYLRVTEAVIAEVQNDRPAVARYLVNITEAVAILAFPLGVGLALVADLFVVVVLGDRWASAIVPMRLLAVASALRALDPLLAQVLVSTGHARDNARSMVLATAVLPIAFLVSVKMSWGLAGVAWVWIIGHPLVVISSQLWSVLRIAETSLARYARALGPAIVCTTIMAIAVVGVRELPLDDAPAPAWLAASVATGIIAYAAALMTLYPQRLRTAWELVKRR
ncbi:MAG TPA: lipopolysaccharide biosynthesis protein [Gemmatimonadaceae bacterium]